MSETIKCNHIFVRDKALGPLGFKLECIKGCGDVSYNLLTDESLLDLLKINHKKTFKKHDNIFWVDE